MKEATKIIYFLGLFLYMMGVIGGTAYLFHDHHFVFGVASILMGVMAFPTAKKLYKKLEE